MRLDRPRINGKQSRTWYVVWTEAGRSHRVSARTTDRRTAEQFLAEYVTARDAPPITFDVATLIDAYLQDAPGEHHHAVAVKRHLGALSVPSLTRSQIRMFHTARRAEGASDSTINRQARLLRAALEWGRKERWLTDLPHIDAPSPAGPRKRFLTQDEFMRLYEAAEEPHIRTFLALAIWTGQRAAAILELRWQQIETERGLIWFGEGNRTKRRAQVVPANMALALALSTAFALRDSDYVVSWRGWRVTSVKKGFAAAVRRAGLSDVRIHDLRRSAASWVLQDGGTFEEAAMLLNDDIRTVQKHYGQFALENMRATTDRLYAHYARRTENET
jgi:integrase